MSVILGSGSLFPLGNRQGTSVATGMDNAIYAAYRDSGNRVRVMRSVDNGASWGEILLTASGPSSPRLAVTSDGLVHLVYSNSTDIVHNVYTPSTGTWSGTTTVVTATHWDVVCSGVASAGLLVGYSAGRYYHFRLRSSGGTWTAQSSIESTFSAGSLWRGDLWVSGSTWGFAVGDLSADYGDVVEQRMRQPLFATSTGGAWTVQSGLGLSFAAMPSYQAPYHTVSVCRESDSGLWFISLGGFSANDYSYIVRRNINGTFTTVFQQLRTSHEEISLGRGRGGSVIGIGRYLSAIHRYYYDGSAFILGDKVNALGSAVRMGTSLSGEDGIDIQPYIYTEDTTGAGSIRLWAGAFILNAQPVPTNLSVSDDSGAPLLQWQFNDPDEGDTQSAYRVQWRKKEGE